MASRSQKKSKFPGDKFRAALKSERPLQIAGTINAYSAILAEKAGFKAIYLSGAGVANASFGIPDLGFTSLEDVVEDVRRIAGATRLPLLVDADTGWGDPKKTVREIEAAGAAGIHLEDQISFKRCGHRPEKRVVPVKEMVSRIKKAVRGKKDPSFIVMARTDAVAVEGLRPAIDRVKQYQQAGADLIFAEALGSLDDYREFVKAVKLPVLANITEFGKTPLFTTRQLGKVGVRMVLYPLSAFRAMSAAAQKVYMEIRKHGSQKAVVGSMQTREELYQMLNYLEHEKMIDRLLELEQKNQ